jgi:hypothetical protein
MADSTTSKKLMRARASFALRYGLAFASVAGALSLDLLFHNFNLPHPFAAFALTAIAITGWYFGSFAFVDHPRLYFRGRNQQPLPRPL